MANIGGWIRAAGLGMVWTMEGEASITSHLKLPGTTEEETIVKWLQEESVSQWHTWLAYVLWKKATLDFAD